MSQQIPYLLVPSNLLKETRNAYTAEALDMIQEEFSWFLDVVVNEINENRALCEYKVSNVERHCEHRVILDSLNDSITCKKFEFVGILCSHVLKVLDLRNIKTIPASYILGRWTKSARAGNVVDRQEHVIEVGPVLNARNHCKELCHNFIKLATIAAEDEEACNHVSKHLANLVHQVQDIFKKKAPIVPSEVASSGIGVKAHEDARAQQLQEEGAVTPFTELQSLDDALENQESSDKVGIVNRSRQQNGCIKVTELIIEDGGYRDHQSLKDPYEHKKSYDEKEKLHDPKEIPHEKKKPHKEKGKPFAPVKILPMPCPSLPQYPYQTCSSMLLTQGPFRTRVLPPNVHSVQTTPPMMFRQGPPGMSSCAFSAPHLQHNYPFLPTAWMSFAQVPDQGGHCTNMEKQDRSKSLHEVSSSCSFLLTSCCLGDGIC